MTARFISYLRVSTDRQGASGLGLEAQRAAVTTHATATGAVITAEYVEVESGKRCDRSQLTAALAECRATGAALLVAKLDRLSRNARFLLTVVDGAGEAGVAFCDLPQLPPGPVGRFILTQMAAVAELEGGLISARTKSALAAAKARGVKLGGARAGAGSAVHAAHGREVHARQAREHAARVAPYIAAAKKAGAASLAQIASALTARGIETPRGGNVWTPAGVSRSLAYAA